MKRTIELMQFEQKIALICNGESIFYNEFAVRVQQLMQELQLTGVCNARMVTICISRSLECVVMIWALLELKIPFLLLPIDTPIERKNYMLYDSNSEYLIECKESQYIYTSLSCQKQFLYSNAALLIYTSGSSGKPKGAVISRKSLEFFWKAATEQLRLKEYMNVQLASAPFSFDSYLLELLLPLRLGKTVILTNEEETKNPRLLGRLIYRYAVDTLLITPTKLLWLLDSNKKGNILQDLNTVILGGEHVKVPLIKKMRATFKGNIINIYGPAEATVFVTYKYISGPDDISIGYELAEDTVHVLDSQLQNVPNGIVGEICITGPSLAEGYINAPELTKKSFVEIEGKKVYRTGDLGKFVDGELFILGRKDRQVKIGGCRIELDEIEKVISSFEKIRNCVVVYNKESELIYAYYESKCEILNEQWYCEMKKFLPEYMIPHIFKRVDEIVRNNSGKVDYGYYENLFKERA